MLLLGLETLVCPQAHPYRFFDGVPVKILEMCDEVADRHARQPMNQSFMCLQVCPRAMSLPEDFIATQKARDSHEPLLLGRRSSLLSKSNHSSLCHLA